MPREEDAEVLDLTEALGQIRVEEDPAVLFEEEETMELAAWKDLPLFNGEDKKNIDSWMGRARVVFTMMEEANTPMRKMVQMVNCKLIGVAQTWSEGKPDNYSENLENIHQYLGELRLQFQDQVDLRRAKREFWGSTQGDRRVVTYLNDVKKNFMKSGLRPDDETIWGVFEKGLRTDIKMEMMRMTYDNLNGCIIAAERAEHLVLHGVDPGIIYRDQTTNQKASPSQRDDPMDLTAIQGGAYKNPRGRMRGGKKGVGHQPRNRQGQYAKDVVCHYCGKKGHMMKDCFLKDWHM